MLKQFNTIQCVSTVHKYAYLCGLWSFIKKHPTHIKSTVTVDNAQKKYVWTNINLNLYGGDYGWLQKTVIYNSSNYNMNQEYKLDMYNILDKYSSLKLSVLSISSHLHAHFEPSFPDTYNRSLWIRNDWMIKQVWQSRKFWIN